MKTAFRTLVVAAFAAAAARAGDWPAWGGGAERNMFSPEKAPLPPSFVPGKADPKGQLDLAAARNVKWAARLGSFTFGSPVVAGGRVFLGSAMPISNPSERRGQANCNGWLICLDAQTGKLAWQLEIPRLPKTLAEHSDTGYGVCSTVSVEGERAYVVSNRSEVLCLDVRGLANGNDGPFTEEPAYQTAPGQPPHKLQDTDGDIIWRYDMLRLLNIRPHDEPGTSVLIHGDLLYVGTGNAMARNQGPVLEPLAPSLIVLDKRTGRLLAVDDEKIGTRLYKGQWSSPCLGLVNGQAQIIYGGGDGVCYAFQPLTPEEAAAVAQEAGARPVSYPRIAAASPPSQTVVPAKSEAAESKAGRQPPPKSAKASKPVDPVFDMVSPEDAAKLPSTAQIVGVPALKKIWWCDCIPPAYKLRDGKPAPYKNNRDGPSEIIATPVFCKNRVYVTIGQDPAFGRGKGCLTCIDATGKGDVTRAGKAWSYEQLERSLSTVAVADGLVFAADIAGTVHCVDAGTGQCVWKQPAGDNVWSSPLVADGKVFVSTNRGNLWVLAAARELKVLAKINLTSQNGATPCAAAGVLYMPSHKYLWAVCEMGDRPPEHVWQLYVPPPAPPAPPKPSPPAKGQPAR